MKVTAGSLPVNARVVKDATADGGIESACAPAKTGVVTMLAEPVTLQPFWPCSGPTT